MSITKIIIFFATLFFCAISFARSPDNFEEFRITADIARKLWRELQPDQSNKKVLSRSDVKLLLEQLIRRPIIGDNGAIKLIKTLNDVQSLYHTNEIFEHFAETITLSNFKLCYNCMLKVFNNSTSIGQHFSYTEIVLPIYTESEITFTAKIKMSRWVHPDLTHYSHVSILLENIGLYDKAWRVIMEEKLKHLYSAQFMETKEYQSDYIHAANSAYRSGNKNLGWSFLMLAAIFDNEKYLNQIIETAKIWIDVESGERELPEQKILTGEERKKAFLEIVERYQKMNAHPRAWLFIQENKKEFDDPDALFKKVQDDWLEIVQIVTDPQIAKKSIMYGVELYPAKNDPLSVKIPWPFPEGSVEKLKEKIQELADKIKEEEKDGLLDWYRSSGDLLVKAKYISCNDKLVIVERENGKKGSIEIERLHDANKNYVYRRLAIRNMLIEDFCTLFHKWNLSDKQLDGIEAKYLLIDKENKITLELKNGNKQTINLSDLDKTEQEYIKIFESWESKKREEQKQKLAELKRKLLSEVKFRQWRSADGFFNTSAKYISYDFQTPIVTIEKPDGNQTTMEFSDLCNEDKKYLRNLLNPTLPNKDKDDNKQ